MFLAEYLSVWGLQNSCRCGVVGVGSGLGCKPAHDALHLPGRKRRHPVPAQQKDPPRVRHVEIGFEICPRKIRLTRPSVEVLRRKVPGALPLWREVPGTLPPSRRRLDLTSLDLTSARGAPPTRGVAAFGDLLEGGGFRVRGLGFGV